MHRIVTFPIQTFFQSFNIDGLQLCSPLWHKVVYNVPQLKALICNFLDQEAQGLGNTSMLAHTLLKICFSQGKQAIVQ